MPNLNQGNICHTAACPAILLIPTLQDRNTLVQAIESLVDQLCFFDKLVISVNGLSAENSMRTTGGLLYVAPCEVLFLCTGRRMSPIRHINFVLNRLVGLVDSNSLVFLLADDDLVAFGPDLETYIRRVGEGAGSFVGTGSLLSFENDSTCFRAANMHIEPGEIISPLTFLSRNSTGHKATNMSSILVPFPVLRTAIAFMYFFGSMGRRLEYILFTHRFIRSLVCPCEPTALIRMHDAQEGRTLSYESYLHDELVYVFWVWLNQPATRPWSGECLRFGFTLHRFRQLFWELISVKIGYSFSSIHGYLRGFRTLCHRAFPRL